MLKMIIKWQFMILRMKVNHMTNLTLSQNNEEEKETVDILEFSNDTINPISPASTPISLTSSNNSVPITLSKPCHPPSSPTTSSLANLQIYLQSKYKVGYH
jgi:hypothetical protein